MFNKANKISKLKNIILSEWLRNPGKGTVTKGLKIKEIPRPQKTLHIVLMTRLYHLELSVGWKYYTVIKLEIHILQKLRRGQPQKSYGLEGGKEIRVNISQI